MAHWSLDDIAWHEFDASKVAPEFIALIKAASLVEYNGDDYARYLCDVFEGDDVFQQAAHDWAKEEVQHGKALRKWAELADPEFNFEQSFKDFTTGYQLPVNVKTSVRGSRCGELVARCAVEIGTSSYYTAIKEYTDEPVLKAVCAKIAADEFRHYKLFYTHLQRYIEIEKVGRLKRIKTVLGRIAESEDDELAYAMYATDPKNNRDHYDRKLCTSRYTAWLGVLYRKEHIDSMFAMAFKTIGLKPHSFFNRCVSYVAWKMLRLRSFLSTMHVNKTMLPQRA